MCAYTDWLDEECGNMAREGLRTLVVAKKQLSKEQYEDFANKLNQVRERQTVDKKSCQFLSDVNLEPL